MAGTSAGGNSIKKRRINLSLAQKYDIVIKFRNGGKKSELSKEFCVPKGTLTGILSEANQIEVIQSFENGENVSMKRKRKSGHLDIEKELLDFLVEVRRQGISASDAVLLQKANDLAAKSQLDNSEINLQWLCRWKKRNNIRSRMLHGESKDADVEQAEKWISDQLPMIIEKYNPADVYNCDETGLFYKAMPGRSNVLKGEKCSGGKMSKERLSVLNCVSMTGEKRKLLVIGKSANPRCFKHVKSLPVSYRSNGKAWMTASIFTEWLKKLDRDMMKSQRKIALILDNCASHPTNIPLQNVSLFYLPPRTTSIIQPLDSGIISSLKARYRAELIKRRIRAMENEEEYKCSVLDAILMLDEAWNDVTKSTIINCFKKAGFVHPNDLVHVEYENELAPENELPELPAEYDDYLEIDNDLIATAPPLIPAENNGADDEEAEVDDEDDEDEEMEEIKQPVSSKEALKLINDLETYLVSKENGSFYLKSSSIRDMKEFCHENIEKNRGQKSIDSFLVRL